MTTDSTSSDSVFAPRWRVPLAVLLLLCLFLFGFRLGSAPIFDLDEALYVTCAKQMVLGGDWTTPLLNSRPPYDYSQTVVPFYEKPIGVYWAAASAMTFFGINEWAARVPVLLAALATTVGIVIVGSRIFGSVRAGLLAGIIYATAPMTLLDARQMTTDGLLVLWFAGALGAYWYRRAWLFGIFCALAVLTKGIAGVLPLLIIGIHTWNEKRIARKNGSIAASAPRWKSLLSLSALVLFLLIAVPWHVRIAQTNRLDAQGRTWVQEYVVRQHVGRFKGMDQVHNLTGLYSPAYIPFFLIGFFPWACFTPAAFRVPPKTEETPDDADEAHRFLLVWFWTIFLFFSASAAKLPTYIVPAYPAAALLVGRWLDRIVRRQGTGNREQDAERKPRPMFWGCVAATLTALLLMIAARTAEAYIPKSAPVPFAVVILVTILMFFLFVGCLVATVSAWRGKNRNALIALTLTMTFMMGYGAWSGYVVVEKYVINPFQQAARDAEMGAKQGKTIVFYNFVPRRPSMLYYVNYSPIERKETPLLPFLRPFLTDAKPDAEIVTSEDTVRKTLKAELAAAPDIEATYTKPYGDPRGGWLRVLIHRKTAAP
jgi:4-amino-4-deoxy-L-arabinose transferase-like glycosyltransferase